MIEKIKAQGLLRPKMYWEDAECGYESYQGMNGHVLWDASTQTAYFFDKPLEAVIK